MDGRKLRVLYIQNNRGSILFSVVMLLSLVTTLSWFMLSDLETNADFTLKTRDYYALHTLKELFLIQYLAQEHEQQEGTIVFQQAKLAYYRRGKTLSITIRNGQRSLQFTEQIS